MNGTIKVAALAALLASAAAFANEDPAQQQPAATPTTPADTTTATDTAWPEFSTLDTNGDGYVSKDEAKSNAALAAKFGELDTDKNGSLSSSEYQKGRDMSSGSQQK
jgi:hypothetical protein